MTGRESDAAADLRPLLRIFEAHLLLEQINERNEECWNEDGTVTDEVTPEQARDLANRLNDAAEAWAAENGIKLKSWAFSDTRNEEMISPAAPPESQGSPA